MQLACGSGLCLKHHYLSLISTVVVTWLRTKIQVFKADKLSKLSKNTVIKINFVIFHYFLFIRQSLCTLHCILPTGHNQSRYSRLEIYIRARFRWAIIVFEESWSTTGTSSNTAQMNGIGGPPACWQSMNHSTNKQLNSCFLQNLHDLATRRSRSRLKLLSYLRLEICVSARFWWAIIVLEESWLNTGMYCLMK